MIRPRGVCTRPRSRTMASHSIWFQLAAALAASKLGAEACTRWLKQPAVVGEIAAGVLLGSGGLGWVDPAHPAMAAIASVGAVLMLFEAGLESDLGDLVKSGLAALWVAAAGVVFTLAAVFGTMRLLGHAPAEALIAAAALSATSVGITVRALRELGAMHLKEARVILGAAVADDVLGLVALAIALGAAQSGRIVLGDAVRFALEAAAFLAGAMAIGPLVAPRVLNAARRMRSPAAVATAAVGMCLAAAGAANELHLAPVVGGFAAGLMLAGSPHSEHLRGRVGALTEMFVPVFFIVMGAQLKVAAMDPSGSAGRAVWLLAGAFCVVVVAARALAAWTLPARRTRKGLLAAGMLPRGEVTLIAAGMGLEAGILKPAVYPAVVVAVIGTAVLGPLLMKAAARRMGEGDL